jgi:oxygen-independent coproporphyrinogen-3 oxidase
VSRGRDGDPAAERAGALGALAGVAPRARTIGLYIHVPFCAKRCDFCSFTTAPHRLGDVERYLAAAHRELDLLGTSPWAPAVTLETVFLGGGTPSLLEPEDLAALLDRARSRFAIVLDAEVTIECTPETVSRARLEAYRVAGVTRVSLGVEALDDGILGRMGRLHDAAAARAAFDAAREAASWQVSVDLMYGLPDLDAARWEATVGAVLDWRPDHLSAYGLTLDEGSVWGSTGVTGLPPEEIVVAQYWALAARARAAGYEHYEISNYALPGCRSRHNQLYWRRREYAAVGPGACGFLGDLRYGNARALARYTGALEHRRLPVERHEWLGERQVTAERLILGLRTADGVPAAWLEARAGGDARLGALLEAWRDRGLLTLDADRACLTEAGFLLSDALFVELL